MRLSILAAALALAAGLATAQRHKLTINAETPEGQLLQQIGQETDESKKLALLEKFAAEHPKHEGITWVYAQMIPAYTKANQFDKAMEAGEKLLAVDPEDLEMAHAALKAAEAKKDPAAVIKWAAKASEAARKVAQTPKPQEEGEVEDWKTQVDFAKQLDVYTEYALYATALQTTDPRKKIQLVEVLEQRNPQSQYLPQIVGQRFLAYRQAGENEKAVALAEKVLEKEQDDEDMLLVVANSYLEKKKEPDKVLAYSARILEIMKTKAKPEGVSEADWDNKKKLTVGLAHWMTGVIHATQGKWAQADTALRAALPLVGGNEQLKAAALFFLGLSNYRLGEKSGDQDRILDAVRFTEQCAAIRSPYQTQARANLASIRRQYVVK